MELKNIYTDCGEMILSRFEKLMNDNDLKQLYYPGKEPKNIPAENQAVLSETREGFIAQYIDMIKDDSQRLLIQAKSKLFALQFKVACVEIVCEWARMGYDYAFVLALNNLGFDAGDRYTFPKDDPETYLKNVNRALGSLGNIEFEIDRLKEEIEASEQKLRDSDTHTSKNPIDANIISIEMGLKLAFKIRKTEITVSEYGQYLNTLKEYIKQQSQAAAVRQLKNK